MRGERQNEEKVATWWLRLTEGSLSRDELP